MAENVTFGVPGENWTEGRLMWQGKPALPLQRIYEDWSQVTIAREQTESVMIQYGDDTGAQPEELERTNEILAKAFDLVADELLNDNIIPKVSKLVGLPKEQLSGYAVTIDVCPESPFGGCMFTRTPEFGDQCVFCGRHYR